jgi:hypothetical protein
MADGTDNAVIINKLLDSLIDIVDNLKVMPEKITRIETDIHSIAESSKDMPVKISNIEQRVMEVCRDVDADDVLINKLTTVMDKNNELMLTWVAVTKAETDNSNKVLDTKVKMTTVRWEVIGKIAAGILSGGGLIYLLIKDFLGL